MRMSLSNMAAQAESKMEKIVSLCKRRGFVYQGSEIYGGLAGTWDFGPLGAQMVYNIKDSWWRRFVLERDDVYGMNAAVLMHPKVWEGSGHTESFTDPLVEDKKTHKRYRADHLLEDAGVDPSNMSVEEMGKVFAEKGIKSPDGNEVTEPKVFNLLVEAGLGAVEGEKQKVYLRGEITQGVHVNFKNILDSMHPKLPFGVAQIGKTFRNEIVPGNFLYRVREFDQMEMQYYVKPDEADTWYDYWKEEMMKWYEGLGIDKKHLRWRQHEENERAHYAKDAWDIEYESPLGWKEMCGIHNRGDWDLVQHSTFSSVDLSYTEPETNEKLTPFIVETSGGVGRAFLFVMLDAYTEDELGGEKRVYLRLSKDLAPIKVAVFPLLKNKPELIAKAREVYEMIKKEIPQSMWDDNGNIGKRYRRQDEIGTPHCVTIDFDTLEDKTVTVRDRDTGEQERIAIADLLSKLS